MIKTWYYKVTGEIEYQEFNPSKSKPIIDKIDKVLVEHYGYTDEELDFIINYDIKYVWVKTAWMKQHDTG